MTKKVREQYETAEALDKLAFADHATLRRTIRLARVVRYAGEPLALSRGRL